MKGFSQTLRFRLTVWYCTTLTVVLLAFGVTVYVTVQHRMVHHHDEPLLEMAAAVQHILNEQPDCHDLLPDQLQTLDHLGRLILVHEVEGGHEIFYESPGMKANALAPAVGGLGWDTSRKAHLTTIQENGLPWRVLSMPYESRLGRKGIIRLMENLGDIEETLRSLRLALLLMTPAAIAVAAAGGFWLSGKALAPVDQITRRAREIEATNLDQRLPEAESDDEIGRLANTLNHMFGRLEASFEAMKRFTADASHELRTPLATLRNTIDVTLERPRSQEEHRTALESVGEEVERLQAIVADLLLLARADAGRLVMRREPIDLGQLASSLATTYEPRLQERGIDLRIDLAGPGRILGDERWLFQAVGNLLDNALKFTPDRGRIVLAVREALGQVSLAVSDSGPGLPEESLDRIFERFFQAESSRNRHANAGAGLGLAIVAWIVQAHGGTITAANDAGGGARFQFDLPAAHS